MSIDFRQVKKQFEKSMQDYDKNAIVQDFMASKLVFELLKFSMEFENILELGAGTGLLTKHLAGKVKYTGYYANDIVEKSKLCIKKIIPDAVFICGNASKIKLDKKVDLIVSNAMFQWFYNIEKFVGILKLKMTNNAILAFSTFSPNNFREIKELTGLSLEYKTKEELKHILITQGFEVLYCEEFYEPMTFETPLELLAHMKKTGVNSLSDKIWNIKKVKAFCDKYRQRFDKTTLTYAPIIIIARLNANPVKVSDN